MIQYKIKSDRLSVAMHNNEHDNVTADWTNTGKICIELKFQNKDAAGKQLSSGRNPMVIAADYGQKDVLEYLLASGADVNVRQIRLVDSGLSNSFKGMNVY